MGTRFLCCLLGVLGKAMAVVVEEKEEEEGEESDHGAPAVVDEQTDTDGKGMGDVYDSVPMETAISAGTHTFAELLQPYIYFIQYVLTAEANYFFLFINF
jgi:hypothetical protein